jgi:hypothetical protein
MRRAARIDANQPAIVEALRAAGASVATAHTLGDGFPDLVVGYLGVAVLMEVKDGSKPPSARQLTPEQVKFHANWKGPISTVTDVEGALRVLRVIEASVCDACQAKAGGFVRVTVETT